MRSDLEFSTPEERAAFEQHMRERRLQRQRIAARRRRKAQIRRNRIVAGILCCLTIWAVVAFAIPKAANQIVHHAPLRVRLTSLVRSYAIAPGSLGTIAWPSPGEGAIAVLGTGIMASSPAEKMVPIASLTKMMTALVVLHDHPLRLGGEGPTFTMTEADYQAWVHASQSDESNVPVRVGEQLSEQQLLEALLIPSADNIADFLAEWDAGSIAKFVVKMNAEAKALGLHSTSYADASGVNPASRSTAANQAVVAATLMANPVVRSIVSHPTLTYPVAGTIRNYNPALGVDGIVGIKSGYTSEAGGCLATAAYRSVGGQSVLVISVATGQPDGLYGAARADEALLTRGTTFLRSWRPTLAPVTIAQAAAGVAQATAGSQVTPLALAVPVPSIVAWPGLKLRATVISAPTAAAGSSAPSVLGELVLTAPFGVVATVPLVAGTSSPTAGNTGSGLPVNGIASPKGSSPNQLAAPASLQQGG